MGIEDLKLCKGKNGNPEPALHGSAFNSICHLSSGSFFGFSNDCVAYINGGAFLVGPFENFKIFCLPGSG